MLRPLVTLLAASTLMGALTVQPVQASPRHHNSRAYAHRQHTKNFWRTLSIGSAATGIYGFASGQGTLGWLGLAGAGYSAMRYEHDRKSQSAMGRSRSRYALRRRHRAKSHYLVTG